MAALQQDPIMRGSPRLLGYEIFVEKDALPEHATHWYRISWTPLGWIKRSGLVVTPDTWRRLKIYAEAWKTC
jgi:hypothetical protein